jgi:hypothetical protein
MTRPGAAREFQFPEYTDLVDASSIMRRFIDDVDTPIGSPSRDPCDLSIS